MPCKAWHLTRTAVNGMQLKEETFLQYGRVPQKGRPDLCQLTENGRTKFADYISVLEQVIKNALPDAHDNHAMLEELSMKST